MIAMKHRDAAKAILRRLANKLPETLHESTKQDYIGDEIIRKISEEDSAVLQKFFREILAVMRKIQASDVEVGGYACQGKIWMRIDSLKKPIDELGTFDPNEFNIFIQSILVEKQRVHLFSSLSHDFSYTIIDNEGKRIRYRACAYYELGDLALNMRAINTEIRPYEEYGFHPNIGRMFSLTHTKAGLVLITGITGSGKSTTLDAIVDLNNRTIQAHIVIIARPIEYIHTSKKCIIRQREVGMDTHSFKHGTIEALRQDPDIIVIGEMRDPQTITASLEAADSGHKVLSTLHTSSATESIDRIVGEMPSGEQNRVRHRLADCLGCVVSQKLIPALSKGMVMAKEVMIMTPSIRAAIRNNNSNEIYQMISEGQKYGMTTLEQDLVRLYRGRKISKENALNFANNKRRLMQFLEMS